MSIFSNIAFIHEGEQAEEYLRKKQEKIDKEKEKDAKRYGTMERDSDGGVYYSAGSRYKVDVIDTKDPKLRKAIEHGNRMEELREKYPNAVPKNATKKDEEILDRAERRFENEKTYGDRIATKRFGDPDDINSIKKAQAYGSASDAACRYYRRHVRGKNESSIFESVQFLNEFGIQYKKILLKIL